MGAFSQEQAKLELKNRLSFTSVSAEYDLVAHLKRQQIFSINTFGPGHRTDGICDHLKKELKEVRKAPLDLEVRPPVQ